MDVCAEDDAAREGWPGMRYDDTLQAWVMDGSEAPECPMCGSLLEMGWNDCRCGLELNVETIRSDEGVVTLVTQEHDEMRELRERVEGGTPSWGAGVADASSPAGGQVALL